MLSQRISIYLLGIIARLSLMKSSLVSTIQDRVEVSTPINSWMRVKEGTFLYGQGLNVYSGGVYHGTPLELVTCNFLIRSWNAFLPFIFIGLDIITSILLTNMAMMHCHKLYLVQEEEKRKFSKDADVVLLKESDITKISNLVAVSYLFSPYLIFSCVAQTTTTFTNFFLACTLFSMVKGNSLCFGTFLACSAYHSFYPVCLLVPGLMEASNSGRSMTKIIGSFAATLIGLILVSSEVTGGWQFLEATYGFILSAPDFTPNIGLFWYFFTEMFEHFRLFFLATFQINAFIYVLPLAIKLRRDPILLSLALLSLTAVFRSYPSLGDVGFYMALLPIWKHLYAYLRQTFLVGCMLGTTSVLGPIMYNLWIFNGSANANFYFAVTLAFNTAQIFLITDLLFAHVKRQYHLYHGSKQEVDGEPATLVLESSK